MKILTYSLCLGLLIAWGCQREPAKVETEKKSSEAILDALPMRTLALDDLSAWKTDGQNWQIAGGVFADYNTEGAMASSPGKGILINNQTETEKANIFTQMEHGDLELELDFMLPKGSNSGIYFQGRYEIQLLDSWKVEQPAYSDCGGIYERWDDSRAEGQKGYEGHAPQVNASKAPGLWQHFEIFFRAPRFDAQGNKVRNAIFEKVVHNGVIIHENVEVTGPTRAAVSADSEVPLAPLMIQGDHGKVAFRNIKYKTYGLDSLKLNNISYTLYDYAQGDVIPLFDTMKVLKEGIAESLDVNAVSTQEDHYALVFKGDLDVPVAGEYLFQTVIDDGGDLFIDGDLVVHNQGEPGVGTENGLVTLTQGKHNFEISFYEEVWSAFIRIYYEGPGISRQLLASENPFRQFRKRKPLVVQAKASPEMIRGFTNYGKEKRTHTISVGDPAGLHYSYDLSEGSLLKFWRSNFADVTQLWQGRGIEQLLVPVNPAIEAVAGVPIAKLSSKDAAWPDHLPDDYRYMGYELDTNDRPVFQYKYKDVGFSDAIGPSEDKQFLVRTLKLNGDTNGMYCRLAKAVSIEKLPNGLYSIDGAYYLQLLSVGSEPIIRNKDGASEMLLPFSNSSEVKYAMLW